MRAKLSAALALAILLVPLAALPAASAVKCFGMTPTMTAVPGVDTIGTSGDDVIIGTPGVDFIYGRGGRDRVCGLGGNDHLYGGAGRDRISGGDGDDFIRGDGGIRNILVGGPGADVIYADGDRDLASGSGGADYISTYGADYSGARGGPGNDTVFAGDWTKLDAGAGRDHCGLSTGVVATNCETTRLFCGVGGADPPDLGSLAGLTSATGNFDGDEDADTLYMWHDDTLGWIMHVELDNGFGARHTFGLPAENLAALGGFDINGDGIDEIFVQAGSNPRPVVGIGTLYLPFGTPTSTCIVEGPEFGLGGDPLFAIGASTAPGEPDNGLACRPTDHTVRLFVQTPWDADTFLQSRYDLTYDPRFGVGRPKFIDAADTHLLFDTPADDDAIQRAREFHCGPLELP